MPSIAVVPSDMTVVAEFVRMPHARTLAPENAAPIVAPPVLYCAAGHGPAPSIAVVCPSDDCENNLAVWPDWFSHTANRQLFVNGIRTAILGAALAFGHLGLAWPIGLDAALLTFLLIAVLLREDAWVQRRTLIGSALMLGALYTLRLPIASDWSEPVLTTFVPIGITAVFLRVAWNRRLPGRLGYFPFFAATVVALGGLSLLDGIAHVTPLAVPSAVGPINIIDLLDMGVKMCASTLFGGVLVGGVLAGRAMQLDPLEPTRIRSPRLAIWTPPRIVRRNTATRMPPMLRSVARTLDTLAYVLARAFRSMTVQTCNACLRGMNRLLVRVFAVVNAASTLLRRFFRRLATVLIETVRLFRDGAALTYGTATTFLRFYLLPLGALAIVGRGILGIQDGISGYIGIGNSGSLALVAVSVLLIVGGVSALAGLQTFTNLVTALQMVLRALVEPAVGALLFFILLSVGLALSSSIVGNNPYSIGPVTIGAALLVAGGLALQLTLGRNDVSRAPVREVGNSAPPQGTAVHVAPMMWTSVALAIFLVALTLCTGGAFA